MKYNSLQIFDFQSDLTDDELNQMLSKRAFMNCGPFEKDLWTWTSPYGIGSDTLVLKSGPFTMLALEKHTKILPKEVIMQEAYQRQKNAGEDVEKIQKQFIHQATEHLLPKAFVRRKKVTLTFDNTNGRVYINNISKSLCDDMFIWLKKNLSPVTFAPLEVNTTPASLMHNWITGSSHNDFFKVENDCQLKDDQSPATITVKHQELQSESILNHLKDKSVTKVALCWNDCASFILQDDLKIARLKYHSIENEDNHENMAAQAEADCIVYGDLYRQLSQQLIEELS